MRNNIIKLWIILMVITCFNLHISWCSQDKEQEIPKEQVKVKKPISMKFKEANIDYVIDFLREVTEMAIVKDPSIKGRITVSCENASIDEALTILEAALKTQNLTMVREGKIIKIVSLEKASKPKWEKVIVGCEPEKITPTDEIITQIVYLKYISAQEVKASLGELLSSKGEIFDNKANNALVIVDNALNVKWLVKIINQLDKEPIQTDEIITTFFLKYVNANEVCEVLNGLFISEDMHSPIEKEKPFAKDKRKAVILSAEFANAIIVVTTPVNLKIIKEIIDQLDKKPSEEQIDTFVYNLKNTKAKEIADVLNKFYGQKDIETTQQISPQTGRKEYLLSQAQTKIVADEQTNSLLIRTSPHKINLLKEQIKELDKRPLQVFIEAIIAEVTLDESNELGVEWWRESKKRHGKRKREYTGNVKVDWGLEKIEGPKNFTLSIVSKNFKLLLRALIEDMKTEILSTPTILTIDNKEAEIIVGAETPYLKESTVTPNQETVYSFEYRDVGIKLRVTPKINDEDYIILSIHQEVKNIMETTMFNANIIAKRQADTSIIIKDGQTVMIGGIIQKNKFKNVKKVPILGYIPLFRYTEERDKKTELLVFITPHIVRTADQLSEISQEEETKYKDLLKNRLIQKGK